VQAGRSARYASPQTRFGQTWDTHHEALRVHLPVPLRVHADGRSKLPSHIGATAAAAPATPRRALLRPAGETRTAIITKAVG
jgi:hypothetical protein